MFLPTPSKPEYANWVSARLVYVHVAVAVLLVGLSALVHWLVVPAALFLAGAAYFAYSRWLFSERGGNVQAKIQALVLEYLHWQGGGEVLDIGCGNGPLTIAIAKAYPLAHVTGIDSWGGFWEFSKAVCEQNATIEGAAERVVFEKASAANLPFADGTFDVVVSNLVFHEVRGVADKKLLLKEALRVLKKGGVFVFPVEEGLRRGERCAGCDEELGGCSRGALSDQQSIVHPHGTQAPVHGRDDRDHSRLKVTGWPRFAVVGADERDARIA